MAQGMRLSDLGISVDVPGGWEGRIYRRDNAPPKVHLANFPLPPDDGDFGQTATSLMGSAGIFIDLFEYDSALAGDALFSYGSFPFPLRAEDFSPNVSARPRPGQAGIQRFFNYQRRAFCLYVVVDTSPGLELQVGAVNALLSSLTIGQ